MYSWIGLKMQEKVGITGSKTLLFSFLPIEKWKHN